MPWSKKGEFNIGRLIPRLFFGGLVLVFGAWSILYLSQNSLPLHAAGVIVFNEQKISDLEGGFTEILDDGDGFGVGVAEIGDLDGDGIVDFAVSAWMDDDGTADHGALYILFMNRNGTVKSSQKISETTGGFSGTFTVGDLGTSITSIGDLDSDGINDLIVGERARDDGGTNVGGYWVLFMNTDGTVKSEQLVSSTTGGFTGILEPFDLFGVSIEPIGDIDGDMVDDIAVSASNDDDGGTDQGAIYVIRMNTNGTVKSFTKLAPGSGFTGTIDDVDRWGSVVAVVSDLDGDGIDDWVTSSPRDDDGGLDRGALYVLFMNVDATIKDFQKISSIEGGFTAPLSDDDRFGSSIDNIGDFNGDGIDDILVGAWKDDDGGIDRGSFYIIFLKNDGTVKGWRKVSDTSGGFEGTLHDSDLFGFQISAVNDLDGNGVNDVLVGAVQDDDGGSNRGAAWVLFLQNLPNSGKGFGSKFVSPKHTSFTINQGAECTSTRDVVLELFAESTEDVLIGDDPYFIGEDWELFHQPSPMKKNWVLPSEDGVYPVYVLYRSVSRNQSILDVKNIRLDQAGNCGIHSSEPVCDANCNLLRFQFYLVTPNGGEITSESEMVRVERTDDIETYFFEDKTDFDFNDVVLEAGREKCGDWFFEVRSVNATWEHKIGVRVFYNDQQIDDKIVFENSHDAVGIPVAMNGERYVPVCK